jgi:NADH-dependent peroxiredoxin subunit F
MNDVIVIGGGPSGIAAASYANQLGLQTVLISPDMGGKINHPFTLKSLSVTDTVRGAATVRSLAAQLPPNVHISAEASHIEEGEYGDSLVVTLSNSETIQGRTLIYAAGVRSRKLYIPGERQLQGKGISYSAVSHASLCLGRDVAVLGNHRRAQLAVLVLARIARSVLFIVPEGSSAETLDSDFLRQISCADNVTIMQGWELTAIEGKDYVKRLVFSNAAGNHRYAPVEVLFIELQLLPNTDMLAHLVERDRTGHIMVNHRCATSHERIFAAGDVTDVHSEQVPVAIGEGIKAALSASEWIGLPQAMKVGAVW